MTRRQAVVKHRRSPTETGPPYGLADLPAPVGGEHVLAGGVLGDARFRSCHGTITVTAGEVRCVAPVAARRAVTWDLRHPRDRGVVAALRRLGGPWELGWREALA